jgi:hypothetical protein
VRASSAPTRTAKKEIEKGAEKGGEVGSPIVLGLNTTTILAMKATPRGSAVTAVEPQQQDDEPDKNKAQETDDVSGNPFLLPTLH